MYEEGRSIQSVEIPCTADSDDDESELEELDTVLGECA
jgi:hypothetical protein